MRTQLSIRDYLKRLLQLAAVCSRLVLRGVVRRFRRKPVDAPQLIREGFEKLGGALLKFGQILSMQVDTLPREYCDALLSLLDRVPQFPPQQVDQIFLEEFRSSPRDLYSQFEYQAIASASIGQVHKAALKDGTPVAVKVQRPGVRRIFECDNRLLQGLVELAFRFQVRSLYFLRDPARELASWTEDELDYRREAAYCQLLGENSVDSSTERVPAVYWQLTNSRVLTMDFLQAPSVAEYFRLVEQGDEQKIAALRDQGFVPSKFAASAATNFMRNAFRFGVFHADPHPANVLILPNNVVGYVDFGIVGMLTPEARRRVINLVRAYSSGDAAAIYHALLATSTTSRNADLRAIRRSIEELAARWYEESSVAGAVRFRASGSRAFLDITAVGVRYGMTMDREVVKFMRSILLAEGLISRLAPGLDLAQILRQTVEDYFRDEVQRQVLSPSAALGALTELALWLEAGPGALLHALNVSETGRSPARTMSDGHAVPRTRALRAAGVWVVVVVVLLFGGSLPSWRTAPFLAGLWVIFVASWTLWLIRLLRRLPSKW